MKHLDPGLELGILDAGEARFKAPQRTEECLSGKVHGQPQAQQGPTSDCGQLGG